MVCNYTSFAVLDKSETGGHVFQWMGNFLKVITKSKVDNIQTLRSTCQRQFRLSSTQGRL